MQTNVQSRNSITSALIGHICCICCISFSVFHSMRRVDGHVLQVFVPSQNLSVKVALSVPAGDVKVPLYMFVPGCCGRNYWNYNWLAGLQTLVVVRVEASHTDSVMEIAHILHHASLHDPASLVYGRLRPATVLGGHSAGAEAALGAGLQATRNSAPDGYILFGGGHATLLRNTQLIVRLHVPLLLVDGDSDCITAPFRSKLLDRYSWGTSSIFVMIHRAVHLHWATLQPDESTFSRYTYLPWCTQRLDIEEQQSTANELITAFTNSVLEAASPESGRFDFKRFLAHGHKERRWSSTLDDIQSVVGIPQKCACCDPLEEQARQSQCNYSL